MVRLAIDLNSPLLACIFEAEFSNPEIPLEARGEIEERIAAMDNYAAPDPSTLRPYVEEENEESEGSEFIIETETITHSIEAMAAIPRSIKDEILRISVDGTERKVGLSHIQAIAVGGVAREGRQPIVVVDLLLDTPWGDRPVLRAIRLTSDTFDPRDLVGGENSTEAFRLFLKNLLAISDAVPLPDPDAARGKPFRSFDSLSDYQREAFGIEE